MTAAAAALRVGAQPRARPVRFPSLDAAASLSLQHLVLSWSSVIFPTCVAILVTRCMAAFPILNLSALPRTMKSPTANTMRAGVRQPCERRERQKISSARVVRADPDDHFRTAEHRNMAGPLELAIPKGFASARSKLCPRSFGIAVEHLASRVEHQPAIAAGCK